MKRLLLLIVFINCVNVLFAQHVNEEQALKKAQTFIQGKVTTVTGGSNHRASHKIGKLSMVMQNDAYYVFNVEDNGGFVIVSGDDRTNEILGYSTEGIFDLKDMPDNMRALLKSYESQIKAIPADAKTVSSKAVTHSAITPMLKSLWGQDSPYNDQCPKINGQRCMTGCVATALAQIMYYHKWPEGYTTEIPAYDYTLSSWNNDSQSWNNLTAEALPATKFDWNNMLDFYKQNSSEKSKTAVSKLMRYCGQAFWMGYGVNESGTNLSFFPTLQRYFGYSDKARYASFANYSPTEWDQLIYNELKYHRPVLYSSMGIFGSHAFVCDGYDGEGYFHMNFGWEGSYNGWYLLSILDGVHNLDYVGFGSPQTQMKNQHAEAIVGIQKSGSNETLPLTLSVTASLQYDNNEESLIITCYNLSNTDQQLECGMRCYDTNGNIKSENYGGMLLSANQSSTGAIPVSVCNFAEGIRYRLCPIWRKTGENDWHALNTESIEIIKLNNSIIELARDGVGASVDVIGQLVENSRNWAIVTINNDGFDLKENVSIDIIDKSTGSQIQHKQYYACLATGEQCKISVYINLKKKGNYEILVKMKDTTIASMDFRISKKINVCFIEDAVPEYDWKTKSFKVLIENKDNERVYDKAIWAYILPREIAAQQPISISSPYLQDVQIIKSDKLYIKPGESKWVTISCGDINVDLLSSAMFVVCQNIDDERYESSCFDDGENKAWYWEYGEYYMSDANGDNMTGYTYKYIKTYDQFIAQISGGIISCYVIDDVSKVCVVYGFSGRGESLTVPGRVKHPYSGEWYSVIGLGINGHGFSGYNSMVIGEGITSLDGNSSRNTFHDYNDKMESITLPASLNHLTNATLSLAAFPNLKSIYCKASVPPVIENYGPGNNLHGNGILYEGSTQINYHPSGEMWIPCKADYSNITLYVPIGSKESYAKAWPLFTKIVEMEYISEIVKGDLNDDGLVSITDVVLIIDVIAGSITNARQVKAADVNQDGNVTITDCVAAIDLIAAQSKGVRMRKAPEIPVNTDHISGTLQDNMLIVNLDNENQNHYTAFQMVVSMPEGMNLVKASIDESRGPDHQLVVHNMGNGKYLVAGYSIGNYELSGRSGRLLTIVAEGQINGDVVISNIEFATTKAESYYLAPVSINRTGTGISQNDNSEWGKDDPIYDLQGRRVNQPTRGLYIVNGSKLIMK